MLVLFSLLSDTFFTVPTFTTIANEIPDLLVMAVGMTFVLMIGGIDLSVGSVLALSASMLSIAMTRFGWGLAPAALLGVLAATAAGALTGTVTVRWGIPSFIVSLGVLEMARGLAYSLTDSRTVYLGAAVDWLATPIALGIAPSFLIAIAITVIGQVVLVRTVFGRYLVAIGTNEEAVRLAGVNPHPYKIAVFALMGWLSGWRRCSRCRGWKRPTPTRGRHGAAGDRRRGDRRHQPHGRTRVGGPHAVRRPHHFCARSRPRADRRFGANQTDHHGRGHRRGRGHGYLSNPDQPGHYTPIKTQGASTWPLSRTLPH